MLPNSMTCETPDRPAGAEPSVDLSRPIPSRNTPEYPTEWPRDDEMPALPRHGLILNYLLTVLPLLLRQRGPSALIRTSACTLSMPTVLRRSAIPT